MATHVSLIPASEVPAWHGTYRNMKCYGGSFAITTTMNGTINNLIDLFTVPKGFTVLRVTMDSTQMDTSTGLTMDLGDAASAARYVAATTIGSSTGAGIGLNALLPAQQLAFKNTADTIITLKIHAATSGTGSAGTVTVWMEGFIDA